jgi:hypothetical protein
MWPCSCVNKANNVKAKTRGGKVKGKAKNFGLWAMQGQGQGLISLGHSLAYTTLGHSRTDPALK